MTVPWSAEDLRLLDSAGELEIAAVRGDGVLRAWTPIWVVCADGEVYVRSWHRRDTGWFGSAALSRRARIRVPRLEAEVTIDDLGSARPEVTAAVDDAYQTKYGTGAASMVTSSAAETTLRLDRIATG